VSSFDEHVKKARLLKNGLAEAGIWLVTQLSPESLSVVFALMDGRRVPQQNHLPWDGNLKIRTISAPSSPAGGLFVTYRLAEQVVCKLYPTDAELAAQSAKSKRPEGADEFRKIERTCIDRCLQTAFTGVEDAAWTSLSKQCLEKADESRGRNTRSTRGRWWVYWFHKHMRKIAKVPTSTSREVESASR
jgi:hypothetical protein